VDLGIKDRVIVVTGGGAGIGEAITLACIDEGARVVVVSRASDNVKNFLKNMQQEPRCDFFEAQLAEPEECRRAIDYIQQSMTASTG